jgi:hypothetical protein
MPKNPPPPFESAESKEAFKHALRSAFAANRALLDFTENVLHDHPTVEPLDAIQKAGRRRAMLKRAGLTSSAALSQELSRQG